MRKRAWLIGIACFVFCLAACTPSEKPEPTGSLSAREELAAPISDESTELSGDGEATSVEVLNEGRTSAEGGETTGVKDGSDGKNSAEGGEATGAKDGSDGSATSSEAGGISDGNRASGGLEGNEGGAKHEEIDYLVLVNSKNKLPDDWEEKLDLVSVENSVGDIVQVERTAYNAYLELKADLMESEGIDLDLDSAYRSVAYQQDILERFTEKYGAAYAAKTVAKPGYSEHHTGLALDLYFRLDGVEVYENEDLVLYPEVWKKIHSRLTKYGFILRYPGRTDGTVDYTYEPWHIRYVGIENAEVISATPGMTLEDYLGKK